MNPQAGKLLAHYRLDEKIGEGGMGVVWKGTDTSLGRSVAIKILPEAFSEDPERLARPAYDESFSGWVQQQFESFAQQLETMQQEQP